MASGWIAALARWDLALWLDLVALAFRRSRTDGLVNVGAYCLARSADGPQKVDVADEEALPGGMGVLPDVYEYGCRSRTKGSDQPECVSRRAVQYPCRLISMGGALGIKAQRFHSEGQW